MPSIADGHPGGTGKQREGTDVGQDAAGSDAAQPGRARQQRRARLALAGIGALVVLVGGITSGIMASQPGRPAWQAASIDNLVLEESPAAVTTGTDYHPITTRAEDPAPLTTAEAGKAFQRGQRHSPVEVSPDCAGAVTGEPVIHALKAAGCTQVLRLITTATGTSGPSVGQIDIFNLAGGPSLTQAVRAFGEESPYSSLSGQPPGCRAGRLHPALAGDRRGWCRPRRRQRRRRERVRSLPRRDLDVHRGWRPKRQGLADG